MILRSAAEYVAPGGQLVVIGHHSDNLENGYGGPQDASVLYSERDVVLDLEDTGLVITRAERAIRSVESSGGTGEAVDAVIVAYRPEQP